MKEYPEDLKREVISQHESGITVAKIAESLSVSRSTVYEWIKQSDQNSDVTVIGIIDRGYINILADDPQRFLVASAAKVAVGFSLSNDRFSECAPLRFSFSARQTASFARSAEASRRACRDVFILV